MTDISEIVPANAQLAGAQSLSRSLQLLRLVAANSRTGLRLVDATRQAGLTRSTAHRLMRALEHEGFVAQDPVSERYYPGIEAHILGLAAEERFGLAQATIPYVAKLAERSGDTCLFQIRRGDETVCLVREEGSFPIRTHIAQPGDRYPLGVGAGGLAILATMPDDQIDDILTRLGAALHERFAVTVAEVKLAVAETRAKGFAVNPGRVFPGSWAIGVALVDTTGVCRGAISLAGIADRIASPRDEHLATMLKEVGAACIARWQDSHRTGR